MAGTALCQVSFPIKGFISGVILMRVYRQAPPCCSWIQLTKDHPRPTAPPLKDAAGATCQFAAKTLLLRPWRVGRPKQPMFYVSGDKCAQL